MRLRHLFASPAFELSERRARLVDLTKDLGHLLYRSVLFGRWKEKSLSLLLLSEALLRTGSRQSGGRSLGPDDSPTSQGLLAGAGLSPNTDPKLSLGSVLKLLVFTTDTAPQGTQAVGIQSEKMRLSSSNLSSGDLGFYKSSYAGCYR